MTTINDSAAFRLSPQQRLGWLTDMPAPSITLHHHGEPNIEWLRHAIISFMERHETLRLQLQSSTDFKVPLQRISNSSAVKQHINISSDNPNFFAELDKVNIEVTEDEKNIYRIHITLPLLSADRGTLMQFAESLGVTHQGSADEDMTYTQYSTWLYELQTDEDAAEGHDYWKNNVLHHSQENDIVYREEYLNQSEIAPTVAAEFITTNAELHTRLNQYCDANDCTPADVLITNWAVLLQNLCSGDTPAINMHWLHDCRDDYDELSGCWGMFTKALPLQWKLPLTVSLSEALSHMRNLQDSATEWQEYYAIETEPAPARYGFEFGGTLVKNIKTPLGALIDVVDISTQAQPFELLLVPEEFTDYCYRFNLHYDPRFYSPQTVIVLLEQYQSLLASVLVNPSLPIKQHALTSETFAKTIKSINTTKIFSAPANENLFPHAFSQHAKKYQNHIALYGHNQDGDSVHLTYAELELRTNRLAHYLRAQGVGTETRVAIYLDRTTDLIMCMIAILKSGAAFLPLETQQPEARILSVLEAAAPALILSSNKLTSPRTENIPVVVIENIHLETATDNSDSPPDIHIQPQDAAYILFTSGSTGTPKGVIIEHGQLHNYFTSICSRINLIPGAKSALVTSLAADLSYTLLFPALLTGGELHIISRDIVMNPEAWAAYQTQHRIEHLKAVPSLVDAWLSHSHPKAVLPATQLILGGESCTTALLNKIRSTAPNLAVYNHYGPTETTVGVIMHKANTDIVYRQLPLSDRLDHMQLYLMAGEELVTEPSKAAELFIGGPQLARGYLNSQQTAERFITAFGNQRLYRTGDLARYRPDGAIEIIGRADRQIKIRGFRIELDEIQVLLANFSDVRQAAVEALPNAQGDINIFAFISLKTDVKISVAQLQSQLQVRLPDYMLPTIRFVEQLPLMANGKLDRPTLREWATKMTEHVSLAPPRNPLEELLVELWAEVLGLEKVGIHDDFFKIGGHSLAAVKLASRIQKALTTDISVNAIFSASTVADFAQLIQQGTLFSPLVNLSQTEDSNNAYTRPNLFCLPPSTGHGYDYRSVAEQLSSWQVFGLQASYLIDGNLDSAEQSVDSAAAIYVARLREQQPDGPYRLIGWSLGGLLAVAAAAQLEAAGETVEFLGIVDTQISIDIVAENIEALIEIVTAELDAESQAKMRNLSAEKRNEIYQLLNSQEQESWPVTLGRWLEQQGMNLEGDSWDMRLGLHVYVQKLIRSFQPPALDCEIHVWWAKDTIESYGKTPLDWNGMTGSKLNTHVIEANHMTILKQKTFQDQLHDCLNQLLSGTKILTRSNHSTAATFEEIV